MTGRDQAHRLDPFRGLSGGRTRRRLARDEGGGVHAQGRRAARRGRCSASGQPSSRAGSTSTSGGSDTPQSEPPTGSEEPPPSGPGLDLAEPEPAPAVLPAVRSGGQVRRAAVAKVLDQAVRDKALGRHLGLVVQRLGARKPAYTVDGDGVVTPASTLKLLTSVAALRRARAGPPIRHDGRDRREQALDRAGRRRRPAAHRAGADACRGRGELSGAGVAAGPGPQDRRQPQGAGCPVGRLCRTTSRSTPARPSTRTGRPTTSRTTSVSPIVPLWVDEGREVDGYEARSEDPAAVAATRFAGVPRQVRRQGHRLGGRTHGAAQAPASSRRCSRRHWPRSCSTCSRSATTRVPRPCCARPRSAPTSRRRSKAGSRS